MLALLLLLALAIAHSLAPRRPAMPQPSTLEQQVAERYGVPVALVQAVVQSESGGRADAVSSKGALGLMQVLPGKFGAGQDPFSPSTNLEVGTGYLASLLREYKGNVTLALAAYNAGPGAVSKYRGVPPYPETQAYVREVLALYRQYRSVETVKALNRPAK